MNDVTLREVTITLDENQLCTLQSMITLLFADNPAYTASRSDMKEIREIINQATRTVC